MHGVHGLRPTYCPTHEISHRHRTAAHTHDSLTSAGLSLYVPQLIDTRTFVCAFSHVVPVCLHLLASQHILCSFLAYTRTASFDHQRSICFHILFRSLIAFPSHIPAPRFTTHPILVWHPLRTSLFARFPLTRAPTLLCTTPVCFLSARHVFAFNTSCARFSSTS